MNKYMLYSLLASASLLPFAASASDSGNHTVGLGVEGYYSAYNEPGLMQERGEAGSITGYYSYEQSNAFVSADGRVSYGTSDYESVSTGSDSGTPDWEFELRGRLGYSFPLWGGSLSPYTGIGGRYYMQYGKGRYTSTFAFAYDRRITQVYIPIGASYAYTTRDGWTITPMIEGDFLIYGDVNSRLANGGNPIYSNISNRQESGSGYGIRGELMFGKAARNYSWQFGPFVRYWSVDDSEISCDVNLCGLEPENDRTQVGMALRFLW